MASQLRWRRWSYTVTAALEQIVMLANSCFEAGGAGATAARGQMVTGQMVTESPLRARTLAVIELLLHGGR